MPIQSFSRYEEKFLVDEATKNAFVAATRNLLDYDVHSRGGAAYGVYNIYFDTVDNEIVRTSLEKPVYKEKLRIRSYRMPVGEDDAVFLELKKKYDGKVNKRRVVLPYRDAVAFATGARSPAFAAADYLNRQVASEIGCFLDRHAVHPNYFIRYERVALQGCDNPQLRITFDRDIAVRSRDASLVDDAGEQLLPKGLWLMEIKTTGNYPLWLADALDTFAIRSRSFSKYGVAYTTQKTGATLHVL
jgi:SPX domain protein involved in polyphosphate accumulation